MILLGTTMLCRSDNVMSGIMKSALFHTCFSTFMNGLSTVKYWELKDEQWSMILLCSVEKLEQTLQQP